MIIDPWGSSSALRVRRLVLLLAVAALVGGCGPDPEKQGTGGISGDNSVAQVRDMLRLRASALMKHDKRDFLEPLSEQARGVEGPIADGAPAVPLATVNFIFTPRRGQGADAGKFHDVEVHMTYQYRGLPEDNLFFSTFNYDLEKINGVWKVTESIPDPKNPLPPWARGPVEVKNTEHFLVMLRPGLERVQEAVDLAEQARDEVVEKLTLVPDNRYLLILAENKAQFEELESAPVPDGVLALASFSQAGQEVPRSRYLVVDLSETFRDPGRSVLTHSGDVAPIQVFRHELGHLALMRYTTIVTSGWIIEGAAMYLSGEKRTQAWRDYVRRDLLKEFNIAGLAGERNLPAQAYPYANAAVLHLVDAYGADRFWNFYRSFKRIDVEAASPGAIAAASQQQLRKLYGLTEEQLDAQTRKWIQAHAGGGEAFAR